MIDGVAVPPRSVCVIVACAGGRQDVAATVRALPETVGPVGLFFDPRDIRAIAETITRILRDDGLRQRFSGLPLKRALEFSWSRAADEAMASICRCEAGT